MAVSLVTLLYLAAHAIAGFPSLADARGDNDSLLRLVQIRDLLAGQGWFDPMQYRMGLETGFAMHWSRLVDLPIAFLVWLGRLATGSQAAGEAFALTVWPMLLFFLILHAIVSAARVLAGEAALLPALVIGALALHFTVLTWPGTIDHHNIQLALTAVMLLALMQQGPGLRSGIVAGVAAAATMAIGMETVPLVAGGGAVAALGFLFRPDRLADAARGFGIGFASAAAIGLAATVAPGNWFEAACDAYSGGLTLLAVTAGCGLAVIVSLTRRAGLAGRAGGLCLLAIALCLLALLVMPACLADPYAGLDPRLQRYWLSAVNEAQPVTSVMRNDPLRLMSYYATPLLGLGWLGFTLARGRAGWPHVVTIAFLGGAVLVSFWQIRGAMLAIPLAAIPLAAWVGGLRQAGGQNSLKPVLAWLLSINLVWSGTASALGGMVEGKGAASTGEAASGASECYAAADYAELAALAPGKVLAVSNLGSAILRHTPHSVFSGPYHRNVDGNLAALDMLMADPETGLRAASEHGVAFIVHCPGNPEAATLAGWAPDSLAAALLAGDEPAGYEHLSSPGAPLTIYRRHRE